MNLRVKEGDIILANVTLNVPTCLQQLPERKACIEKGVVLKSSSFLYGRDTDRKGLIVLLRAKSRDDDEELPYMVTLKHYLMIASCSNGVSAVAKIFRDNTDEGFSIEIEKPSEKPIGELVSMFDDIKGKGWWPDPTSLGLLCESASHSLSRNACYNNGRLNNNALNVAFCSTKSNAMYGRCAGVVALAFENRGQENN